jgi:glycosyltransferase involved in cell wall biosynthesis
MKILMIAPEPFFTPRGTPFSIRGRIQALSALGHSVDLVTYHIGSDISIPGLRIYRSPRIPWIQRIAIGPSIAKIFLDALLFGLAMAKVLGQQYDVIHTHEEAGLMGVVLAPVAGAYHVYDMHSSLPQQFQNFKAFNFRPVVKLFEAVESITIRRADAVIAVCPELRAHVATIDQERPCFLIENTV